MVGRAHRLSRENCPADADDRGLAHTRLRRGDGMAVPASSAHRYRQSIFTRYVWLRRCAAQHHDDHRHGLGAGAQSHAGGVYHDCRRLSRHGSQARRSRGSQRREYRENHLERNGSAHLAGNPRGGNLYFYCRTFGLRRAGDHRLVQPHFYFQHLHVPDGQPPGRSAALRLERDFQHHRHRSRRGSRLVVRTGAKAQSPV